MTTMTTQDERPVQDEAGDVRGYLVPVIPLIICFEIGVGAALFIGSGAMDAVGEGISNGHRGRVVRDNVGNKI